MFLRSSEIIYPFGSTEGDGDEHAGLLLTSFPNISIYHPILSHVRATQR